ncbi:hypothetical protein N7539_003351 [Penicillium diatomitis]|uniref:Cellobiose dehydrogenase cytochrome domain-containing protein n=1 Tax=Penicillium diatomitis TaxID=2819901 RepID=A0A9W9XC72_9EURO|nr:uncharacterized protein N7539_003351 [Penicillium diatomitis]KAJ5488461.1 hypothetical protein N7539_003351 [Penicillium diatomitis]
MESRPARFNPPGRSDISFIIAIQKAPSGAQQDSLLLQIQAPNSVQWIGIGHGSHMAGAAMFVAYASSAVDVIVSPREATGHIPPEYDANNPVSILLGTGIANGTITANFECKNCLDVHGGTINATDSTSNWIWAYKNGPPLASGKLSASIAYHDAFGRVLVDLSRAQSVSDFRSEDGSFTNARPLDDSSTPQLQILSAMAIAHGCLMAVAFVVLFPIFALLVPLSSFISMPVTTVHAPLQGLALATAVAGFGLGLKMWLEGNSEPAAHPIIGIIVVASLALIQPTFGWFQHRHFRRNGTKSPFAFGHRWLGRSMLALGAINGGLGFWWVGSDTGALRKGMIAYAVVAGVVGLMYIIVHLWIRTGIATLLGDVQGARANEASNGLSKRESGSQSADSDERVKLQYD